MNTKMFLKIIDNLTELKVGSKDGLIISGIGVFPIDVKEYFKKTLIKRNRAIVDMKKNIAKTIIEVHNEEYKRNKDLCYTLTEIANLLDIKSHSSILSYFKNEKKDDELSLFVKKNFIRWISEKKYPMPFQKADLKDFYVMIKDSELQGLKLTGNRKINSEDFYLLIDLKKREHFIGL